MKASELTDEEAQGCIAQIVVYPGMAAYFTFVDGWVLSKLWAWHAVPLGARPLHWHTFAAMVLAYLVIRNGAHRGKDDRSPFEQLAWLASVFAMPWMALLLGWWWA